MVYNLANPAGAAVKTVTDCFGVLDEALKLDTAVDARAKQIRSMIDEVLTDAGWCAVSLLQGSHGRKTMYPPLKDVDLVVVLPESLKHLRDDPNGPAIAMAGFREAIVSTGNLLGVRFDVSDTPAHALQLSVPDVDFTFDLVPAFETADPDWLVIADRKDCRWDKRSDVRGLRNKVVLRNVKCLGGWVRQVRQAKHALRQAPAVKKTVCGLVIESLAYDAVTSSVTWQEAAEAIFARGARVLTGTYHGLAQDDLTGKWTSFERAQVVDFFARNQLLAAEAIRYEADKDHAAASAIWRQVFGEQFPVVSVSFRDKLPTLLRTGGGLTSTGHLTTSPAAPAATNPARPWRAR